MTEPIDPQSLSALLGLLTHDMRNPLSALHSNLNYLSTALGTIDRDLKEAAVDAVASCDGLMHVIENMEILSFHVAEGLPLPHVAVGFSAFVTEVVERSRLAAESHGVAVQFLDQVPRGVRVRSNRQMLARAVENLVRGAIQYCPPGTAVSVVAKSEGGRCSVEVSDLGTPLQNAESEELFSVAGQLKSKTGGAGRYSRGLGFLCVKICADAAGAEVKALTLPAGQGFEISLPVYG